MLFKFHIIFLLLLSSPYVLSNELLTVSIQETDFTFSRIMAGSFDMGDAHGQQDELPIHTVSIDSFYMQTTEVTVEQYTRLGLSTDNMDINGCWYFDNRWKYAEHTNWKNPGYKQNKKHPVVCVSWIDVQRYINHLNTLSPHQFRLPSEAEWEYATRAHSKTRFYWGSEPAGLCTHANASDLQTLKRFPSFVSNKCDDGYLESAPVKSYLPNPFGLYDVYGNVWEWTQDCWNTSYINAPIDGSAWLSGQCSRRIFRGGGWGDNPKFARSSLRNRADSDQRKDDIGFRLVMIPK